MTIVDAEKLAILNRFQNGLSLLPLVFYTPLGIILTVLRCFIFAHALIIFHFLSKISFIHGVVLRLMFAVCGLVVTTSGSIHSDRNRLVQVANHMTSLDPFILNLVMHYILVLETSSNAGDLTQPCSQVTITGEMSREEVVQFIKKNVQDSRLPLLIFPEGGRANNLYGLMKFRSLPFHLGAAIQPIGIVGKRSFLGINISTYASPWWADLLLCFFVPFTVFNIKFLPLTEQRESETSDQFCERVQSNLARGLGICTTEVTPADLRDFVKKKLQERPVTTSASPAVTQPTAGPSAQNDLTQRRATEAEEVTSSDPALNIMLKQVREVLPHARGLAVLQDLEQTRDVDATITNILEGRVDLEQKPVPPQPSLSDKELNSTTFKASTFSKSAVARQLSLQERKQAMLEAARQSYKEKHNIP